MRMLKLQPVLDLLDEGLRLYRRGFVGFVTVAALWLIPVLFGVGLTIGAAQFWEPVVALLVALFWLVLLAVLSIYLVGVLSRATLTIQQEGRVNIRTSLAIHPFRLAGMGCYGAIYYLVSNLVVSAISMVVFCSFYLVSFLLLSVSVLVADGAGSFGDAMVVVILVVFTIFLTLFYGLGLALGGATYSSLIYGLQPFIQERLRFGEAIERSINLTFYRPGYTLLAFLLSSVVFSSLASWRPRGFDHPCPGTPAPSSTPASHMAGPIAQPVGSKSIGRLFAARQARPGAGRPCAWKPWRGPSPAVR